MFNLYQAQRRPPLSDWIAQVERRLERHGVQLHKSAHALLTDYYNVGLSVEDASSDLLTEY